MEKTIRNFEDLNIRQKTRELSGYIYELTKNKDFSKDYSLVDQIRRYSILMLKVSCFQRLRLKPLNHETIKLLKKN
jgi:hypothetical protein